MLIIYVRHLSQSATLLKQHNHQNLNHLYENDKNEFLNEASQRIQELEDKLQSLEARIPKTYPEVKFLNYLTRKRILVSLFL